jgi:hypothetical protein
MKLSNEIILGLIVFIIVVIFVWNNPTLFGDKSARDGYIIMTPHKRRETPPTRGDVPVNDSLSQEWDTATLSVQDPPYPHDPPNGDCYAVRPGSKCRPGYSVRDSMDGGSMCCNY